jgi:integrase
MLHGFPTVYSRHLKLTHAHSGPMMITQDLFGDRIFDSRKPPGCDTASASKADSKTLKSPKARDFHGNIELELDDAQIEINPASPVFVPNQSGAPDGHVKAQRADAITVHGRSCETAMGDCNQTFVPQKAVSRRVLSRISGDVVVGSTRPATLAEAIESVADSGTVDAERLKSFRRDVRWVQTRLPVNHNGAPTAPLPCDPQLLRPILQSILPAKYGISAKRFQNIRNELAAIQRKTGWLNPRIGRLEPQSEAWNIGMGRVADAAKNMFRNFAVFCEDLGLEPTDVTAQHIDEYRTHMEKTGARMHPGRTAGALRYAWNRVCRLYPDWPGNAFPAKPNPNKIRDDNAGTPKSFHADLNAYITKLEKPGLFDRHFRAKVAPATIRSRKAIYLLSPSVLIKQGWDPQVFVSLKEIVTPAAVEGILTAYHNRNCEETGWTYGAEATAAALKTLAIQWGDLSADDLDRVKELCASVRCKKSPFPKKAQERLRQFDDRSIERRFWELPGKLWEAALRMSKKNKGQVRAAQTAKAALALAIAFDKPLRISNLTNLDLILDFVRDQSNRVVGIRIEGDRTTKGAAIIEGALSSKTQKMILIFLEKFRPVLIQGPTNALFPGQKAEYLCAGSLGHLLETTIRRNLGIDVNPHLIRSFIGTVILDENPHNVVLAQRALDHKSPTTTLRSYAMQRGRSTAAQYAETIHQRIRRLNK